MPLVNIIRTCASNCHRTLRYLASVFFATFAEALFPLSREERDLRNLSPEQAYITLSKAPPTPSREMSAVFAYKDPIVQRLIWSLKYAKSSHAANICGYALMQKIGLAPAPVLIPLPIAARRRRERGFNQTESIVDAMKHYISCDSTRISLHVRTDILTRTAYSSRQTLKGRAERIESARDIFAVTPNISDIPFDAHIIIIDDVITTGSTMDEAIRILKKAGFTNVTGLSVAH